MSRTNPGIEADLAEDEFETFYISYSQGINSMLGIEKEYLNDCDCMF